jgi:pimeloyl-ACP methyl ester carboxylesterase
MKMEGGTMPFGSLRGRKVYYEENGKGKPGIPILFLHGAGGNQYIWEEQLNALALYRPVIALDLPGHGKSEGAACSNILEYAEWVSEFIDERFGDRQIMLAGHSMGGAIAQQLALLSTGQLIGILLITTGAKLGVRPETLDALRQGVRDREAFLANFSPKTSKAIIDVIAAEREFTSLESTLHDYLACDAFDLRESVSQIKMPTLIIGGEDDAATPPKFSHYLHATIQGSQIAMLQDAGHYVMVEQSAKFNHIVEEFMERMDRDLKVS